MQWKPEKLVLVTADTPLEKFAGYMGERVVRFRFLDGSWPTDDQMTVIRGLHPTPVIIELNMPNCLGEGEGGQ